MKIVCTKNLPPPSELAHDVFCPPPLGSCTLKVCPPSPSASIHLHVNLFEGMIINLHVNVLRPEVRGGANFRCAGSKGGGQKCSAQVLRGGGKF